MTWTSPRTWVAGETVTAAILNTHVRDNLLDLNGTSGAWNTYTPTLTQSATITKTVNEATWKQIGKLVEVHLYLSITSAGTAANNITIGLPVAARALSALDGIGPFTYNDTGATFYKGLVARNGGSTSLIILQDNGSGFFGTNPAVTAASGDIIWGSFTYEAV